MIRTLRMIVENDEDAYEAQTILQDLLANHINPAYSINGNSVSALEVPLRSSFLGNFT